MEAALDLVLAIYNLKESCGIAGDAGAWSVLMQRLIFSSHLILDGLFLGMEGEAYATIRSVAPC